MSITLSTGIVFGVHEMAIGPPIRCSGFPRDRTVRNALRTAQGRAERRGSVH